MNTPIIAEWIKIEKTIFDSGEPEGKPFVLGGMLSLNIPKCCDLIVLAGNKGGGYEPYRCLLPHQVYVDDIKKDFEKHNFEVIYVLPVSSQEAFDIAYRDSYSENRWKNK